MFPLRFVCDVPIWVHTGYPNDHPQRRISRFLFTPKNVPPWLKNTTVPYENLYQTPSHLLTPLYVQSPMYIQQMQDYQSPNPTFMNVPPGNDQSTNIQGNVGQINHQVMPSSNPNVGQIVPRRRIKFEETNDQAMPMTRPSLRQNIPKGKTATVPDNRGRQMIEKNVAKDNISNKNMSHIRDSLINNSATVATVNCKIDEYTKCDITVTAIPNRAKLKTVDSTPPNAGMSITPLALNVRSPTKPLSISTQTDVAGNAGMQHTENKACNDFNSVPMLPVTQQNNEIWLPKPNVIEPKPSAATIVQRTPNDNQFLSQPVVSLLKMPLNNYASVSHMATSPHLSDSKSDVRNTENNYQNNNNNKDSQTFVGKKAKIESTITGNNDIIKEKLKIDQRTVKDKDNQTLVRKKVKIESTITGNNDIIKEKLKIDQQTVKDKDNQTVVGKKTKIESTITGNNDIKIEKPDNKVNCTTANSKAITSDSKGTCNNGTVEKKSMISDKTEKESINDRIKNILREYVEYTENCSKSNEKTVSKYTRDVKEDDKKSVIGSRTQMGLRSKDEIKKTKKTENRLELDKKSSKIKTESTTNKPKKVIEKDRLLEVECDVGKEMKPLEGKIDLRNEPVPVILTHILDGYIIQESNVAFAIRKPLKEKNISDRTPRGQINEKSEQRKEDTVKNITEVREDKPFANLIQSEVNKWTLDELSQYLSKHNWQETMYAFRAHEVDGEALLLASKGDLLKIGVEESQADIISSFIEKS